MIQELLPLLKVTIDGKHYDAEIKLTESEEYQPPVTEPEPPVVDPEPPVVEPPVIEPPVIEPEPPSEPPVIPPYTPPDNDLSQYHFEADNPPATIADIQLSSAPLFLEEIPTLSAKDLDTATRRNNFQIDMLFRDHVLGTDEARTAIDAAFADNFKMEYHTRGHRDYILRCATFFSWAEHAMTAEEKDVFIDHVDGWRATHPYQIDGKDRRGGVPYFVQMQWGEDGGAYELIWALAIYNYREWAKDYVYRAWHNDPMVFSPYRALGALGLMANLEGGGPQAGNHATMGAGYEGDFSHGASYVLAAWRTKTGESLFDKTNYFSKAPEMAMKLYLGNYEYSDATLQFFEFITGFLPGTDAARRSEWIIQNVRRAKYADAYRFALGRLTGDTKGPEGLPSFGYVDGAGVAYWRDGWSQDSTQIYITARERDLFRNENQPGCFAIKHKGEWLMPIGSERGKAGIGFASCSTPVVLHEDQDEGSWPIAFDDPNTAEDEPDRHTGLQIATNYWGSGNRAFNVEQVLASPGVYTNNTFQNSRVENGIWKFTVNIGSLHRLPDTTWVQHFEIEENLIRIYTTINTPHNAYLEMRFNRRPEMLEGGVFQNAGLKATVKGPAFSAQWLDGFLGPMGYWRDDRSAGYDDQYFLDKEKADIMGAGSVWIKPIDKTNIYQFEQTIELI